MFKKDVEQFIKPFNRFEMANGKRGVFLELNGKVVGSYFERQQGCFWHTGPLYAIQGGDTSYRAVKIWTGTDGCILQEFDYSVAPVWEEQPEEQKQKLKKLQELEETIKQAQQQIETLKKEVM